MSDKANKKVFVIGLTGQSGSGKTVISEHFAKRGAAVINADIVARGVTADGSECNAKLRELFPSCVDDRLVLDRRALAAVVFNDRAKLDMLNDTIFPYINDALAWEIERIGESGSKIIVLDAPTLFEAGADKLCDMIISVVADEEIRAKRIQKRDGLTREQAAARFSSQRSVRFFKEHSDIVIENNGSAEELVDKAEATFRALKEKADV